MCVRASACPIGSDCGTLLRAAGHHKRLIGRLCILAFASPAMSYLPGASNPGKIRNRPVTSRRPHVFRLQLTVRESWPKQRQGPFYSIRERTLLENFPLQASAGDFTQENTIQRQRAVKPQHYGLRASTSRSGTKSEERHIWCKATSGGSEPPRKPPSKPPPPGDDDDEDDDEQLYNEEEAEEIAASENVQLPEDFLEAARGEGLRKGVLDTFIKLQKSWLTRLICNSSRFLRDRLLYDPRFLFIVLAEIAIDTACATIAEVRKRGEDFWSEFEFYLSDLTVGLVLDVLLVGLMATPAVISKHHAAHNAKGFKKLLARTPKAVFEPNTAGERKYTTFQRLFCLLVKFGEYSSAGIICGILGQSAANVLMKLKRTVVGEQRDDVELPPVVMTGLTWGLFMGGSSNVRYQTIFAVERLVDKTIAKRLPKAPYVVSFILRLINNIWGGENFIDHARWTGIQPGAVEDETAA